MSLAQVSSLDTARGSSLAAEAAVAANGRGAEGSSTALRNEFLQMMVAQVQNQDPLNPMDGTQYVGQLAQFSMVEGVENLRVIQQQALVKQDTQQVLQSTALVGKEVMVPSERLVSEVDQPIRGQISLQQPADAVVLNVYDPQGHQVASRQWGPSDQGALAYDLETLPAGEYRFEVMARQDGAVTRPQNYVAAPVERVALSSNGQIQLQVAGVGPVSLFDIVEFGKAKA